MMILAAIVIAGVTILAASDPAPECRTVDRRISVKSEVSHADAYAQLAAAVTAAGGDTARLSVDRMVSYDYPARRVWRLKARGYLCRTEAAGEE